MKKFLSVMLCITILFTCVLPFSVSANDTEMSGTGEKTNPFIIDSPADFEALRSAQAGEYYCITADITLPDTYTPIELNSVYVYGDDAVNLRKINVTIASSATNAALFSSISGGEVSNLQLEGTVSGTTNVGGFAGTMNKGKIINCVNNAAITATGNYCGGIAGYNNASGASIEKCSNINIVKGTAYAGGILGYGKVAISKCSNRAAVSGTGVAIGGIIGGTNGSTINECYNVGEITSSKNGGTVAGIVGLANKAISLTNCYNTAKITHTFKQSAYGIIGSCSVASVISNCYNTASEGLNGPIAPASVTAITNCYYLNTMTDDGIDTTTAVSEAELKDVNMTKLTGFDTTVWDVIPSTGYEYPQLLNNLHPEAPRGNTIDRPILIDSAEDFELLKDAQDGKFYSIVEDIELPSTYVPFELKGGYIFGADAEELKTIKVTISSTATNTGLFTKISGGKLENIKLIGTVSGSTNTGGFAGEITAGELVNCVNDASITSGANYVAGLVGYAYNASMATAKFTNCQNTGEVSGNAYVGGIVGYGNVTITKCSNHNVITGTGSLAGGLIGGVYRSSVSESYNNGAIICKKNGGATGGIAGGLPTASCSLTMTNCYNNGTVTHTFKTGAAGLVGLTTGAVTMSNCYSTITTGLNFALIPSGSATVSNCYYSDILGDDGIEKTTALSASSMKDITKYVGFTSDVWAKIPSSGYFYPQLLNNPHPAIEIEIGSSEDYPIIIDSYEDFETLRDGGEGKYYSITADINLPEGYEPFELKDACLYGSDYDNLKAINVVINKKDTDDVGLFTKISGLVKIKNIRLTGSITGYNDVGGFIGSTGDITSGCEIENCINEATVSGNNAVGGFIGTTVSGNITITNLTNKGNISGHNNIGGILGTSPNVYKSRNLGTISGADNIGGIVGFSYGSAYECYNNGKVEGRKMVGGIFGSDNANGRTIKDSYNTGVIISSGSGAAENEVGGILGGMYTANKNFTLENCYNIGEVYTDTGSFNPIAPVRSDLQSGYSVTFVNCYYADPAKKDDGKEGTTAVTKEELKNLIIEGSKFVASQDAGYVYPQISTNAQIEDMEFFALTTEADENLVVYPSNQIYVKGGNEVTYKISANDNYMINYVDIDGQNITDLYNKKRGTYRTYAINSDTLVAIHEKAFELPEAIDVVQNNFVPEAYGKAVIVSDTIINTPYGISFSAVEVFNECELVEYGMIFSSKNAELDMESYEIKVPAQGMGTTGQFGVLFYGASVLENTTYYTRAYAIYEKDGVSTVIMGNPSQFVTTSVK